MYDENIIVESGICSFHRQDVGKCCRGGIRMQVTHITCVGWHDETKTTGR